MGRVVDDEAGDDEEQVDATASAGEHGRHDAFGDLVAFRRNAPGMKGNHGKGRKESEHLNVNKHRLCLLAVTAPSHVAKG